jgi:hypothetical protein
MTPESCSDGSVCQSTNQRPPRRQRPKTYPVTEFDLTKLSKLFGCLEEALKEMIRNRGRQDPDNLSEMYLYEMTSRALVETDDPELSGSLELAYQEDGNL